MPYLKWIELIASLLTIWGVWLNARPSIWGWPVGLVSVLLSAMVYFRSHLFAEFGLQLFYAVSSVYGWWKWQREGGQQQEIKVQRIGPSHLIWGGLGGLTFTFILAEVLKRYTSADLPYLDSGIASFSLIAQVWMARKYLENWLLWTAINLVSVGVYAFKDLWFFMGLYTILLFIGIVGYFQWGRVWKANRLKGDV